MEGMPFSREFALDSMNRIRAGMNQVSRDLYKKYECMHDAYLRGFNLAFPDDAGGCTECSLTLDQDYVDPPSTILIRMHAVRELELLIAPGRWLGTEIHCLYFGDCADGIQLSCSTDERVNFRMRAESVEIEEKCGS